MEEVPTKKNEGLLVTGGNVQIGNAAVGRGATLSVVLKESLTRTEAVRDQPELQAALRDLCAKIAELTARLPAANQAVVARDLEAFVSEATSPKPRKPWYEISGQGLIDAAKTVAALADPVAKAVKLAMSVMGG